jgi:catechol 2,3-dioxygenase-like lactoylglutathione lyase family enzyme
MNLALAIPALPVRQVTQSVDFYRDQLGFGVVHQDTGFAIVRRDAVEIHLWEAGDEGWRDRVGTSPVVSGAESFIAGTASCRVQVAGVEDLHSELQPRGILHPNAQIANQPWGTREFGVLDVDGNLITFFEWI